MVPWLVLGGFFLFSSPPTLAANKWTLDFTLLPSASLDFKGEANNQDLPHTTEYEGQNQPLYIFQVRRDISSIAGLSGSLWFTGLPRTGAFARETVGNYQQDELNITFTHLFLSYHHKILDPSVEMLASFSIVREVFTRKDFVIQGNPIAQLRDVNEISAEGLGIGLQGRHGKKPYFRWQALSSVYIQLFDCDTDCQAGETFNLETGVGVPLSPHITLEGGGLWQYWTISSQGSRLRVADSTPGAIISWSQQSTTLGGFYIRWLYSF